MTIEGPNSVGNAVDFGGDFNWQTLSNLSTSDDTYATLTDDAFGGVGNLVCSSFGFAIPDGATIDGVTIEVEMLSTNQDNCVLQSIRLLDGSTEIGDVKFPTTFISAISSYVSYGGESDTWGASLNSGLVNTSLGVRISIYVEMGQTASVDHVRATINYTVADVSGSTTIVRRAFNGLQARRLGRSFNVN